MLSIGLLPAAPKGIKAPHSSTVFFAKTLGNFLGVQASMKSGSNTSFVTSVTGYANHGSGRASHPDVFKHSLPMHATNLGCIVSES